MLHKLLPVFMHTFKKTNLVKNQLAFYCGISRSVARCHGQLKSGPLRHLEVYYKLSKQQQQSSGKNKVICRLTVILISKANANESVDNYIQTHFYYKQHSKISTKNCHLQLTQGMPQCYYVWAGQVLQPAASIMHTAFIHTTAHTGHNYCNHNTSQSVCCTLNQAERSWRWQNAQVNQDREWQTEALSVSGSNALKCTQNNKMWERSRTLDASPESGICSRVTMPIAQQANWLMMVVIQGLFTCLINVHCITHPETYLSDVS